MKRLALALLLGLCLPAASPAAGDPAAPAVRPLSVALVLSIGGLRDHGFNEAAYEGAAILRARDGVHLDVYEPGGILAIGELIEAACSRDYDLVVAVGCLAAGDLKDAAARHPRKNFAIIDSVVLAPNVASYVFRDDEGARYAGRIAALLTRTGKVAFLGGMRSPVIENFHRGFVEGVRDISPKIVALGEFAGETPDAFVDPAKGKALAESLFASGVDALFPAAGLTGLGAIEAAKRPGRYVIGVDADQSGLAPKNMPASVLKRIDVALLAAVADRRAGRSAAVVELGIAEGGVALSWSKTMPRVVTAKLRARVESPRGATRPPAKGPAPR